MGVRLGYDPVGLGNPRPCRGLAVVMGPPPRRSAPHLYNIYSPPWELAIPMTEAASSRRSVFTEGRFPLTPISKNSSPTRPRRGNERVSNDCFLGGTPGHCRVFPTPGGSTRVQRGARRVADSGEVGRRVGGWCKGNEETDEVTAAGPRLSIRSSGNWS